MASGEQENVQLRQTVQNLLYVLSIATQRAVEHGDRLVECGKSDMNRGQFLSLVDSALKSGCEAIGNDMDAQAHQGGWDYSPGRYERRCQR